MHALLRTLALALVGLSLAVWLLAAGGGYLVCRRALLPVTRMAAAARGINAAALDQRLPTLANRDELADLSRAFNELLGRLQESFERQRRFTGDASHQLRTPLAAMLGQVEVALRRPRSPEEYERVLGLVREQSVHLRQIVETLLFLARADAESKQPQLDRIDLAAWLREHVGSWSNHARAADLVVECPPQTALWANAQAPLLGQLVDNVWDNACKYSEPGTPITVRLGYEAGLVCLSLEDQGCGIAADELPLVFEPFFRSCRSRQAGVGGVGLGLAVVERIAAALGGTTGLQSEAGKGATFRLCLPGQAERLPTPAVGKSGALTPDR
jgi:signal transduction histidine kinase